MLTFRLGLPWRHHSTPDPPGLEAPRTQASAGPEVPCPSSHPQDLRVERGEGGPLLQVTWRHLIWSIANLEDMEGLEDLYGRVPPFSAGV